MDITRYPLFIAILLLVLATGCGGGDSNPFDPGRFDDGNNSFSEADPFDSQGEQRAVLTLPRGDTTDIFGPLDWQGESGSPAASVELQADLTLPQGAQLDAPVGIELFTNLDSRGAEPGEDFRSFRNFSSSDAYGFRSLQNDGDSVTLDLAWLGPEFREQVWVAVSFQSDAGEEQITANPEAAVDLSLTGDTKDSGQVTDLEPNNTRDSANPLPAGSASGRLSRGDETDWVSFFTPTDGQLQISGSADAPVGLTLFAEGNSNSRAQISPSDSPSLQVPIQGGNWLLRITSPADSNRSYSLNLQIPGGPGQATRRIAFTAPGVGQGSPADLFRVRPNGSGLENLTQTTGAIEQLPATSADGQTLTVLSEAGSGEFDLGVFTGGNYTTLSAGTPIQARPRLSADGSTIFFNNDTGAGSGPELATLPVTGGSPTKVLDRGSILDVSPSGSNLLLGDELTQQLFLASETGGRFNTLLNSGFDPVAQGAQFAPDGESVFYSDSSGRIIEHDLTTGNETQLPDLGGEAKFDVSPDGAWIGAVVLEQENTSLKLIDISAGAVRSVSTQGTPLGTPSFSPDSSRIVWAEADSNQQNALFVSEVNQPSPQQVPNTSGVTSIPVWSF